MFRICGALFFRLNQNLFPLFAVLCVTIIVISYSKSWHTIERAVVTLKIKHDAEEELEFEPLRCDASEVKKFRISFEVSWFLPRYLRPNFFRGIFYRTKSITKNISILVEGEVLPQSLSSEYQMCTPTRCQIT